MATTSDLLTSLKALTGKPNDDTYLKEAIVAALREVRNERATWAEDTFRFYTEANTSEYSTSYPGLPADLLMFDSLNCSTTAVADTAVMQFDALITKTNLTTGASDSVTLGWVQDRPHDPDPSTNHLWTSADTASSQWVGEFETPANAVPNGTGRQKIRILARQKNDAPSSCTVTLTDTSTGSTQIFSESITLSATSTVHEFTWDARMLDVNPPTGLRLDFSVTPSGTANGELLAVEWITDYSPTGDSTPMRNVTIDEIQSLIGGAGLNSTGIPHHWCWHHDKIILEPVPQGVYEIYGTYFKDSTRDSNGDEITTSFAGTETNDWLDRGLNALKHKALEIYYMSRAQNPEAAQMARMQYLDSLRSIRRENVYKNFRGPIRGYL